MLPPNERLLDQVRDHLRVKDYDHSSEKSCLSRIKQYSLFNEERHQGHYGNRSHTAPVKVAQYPQRDQLLPGESSDGGVPDESGGFSSGQKGRVIESG